MVLHHTSGSEAIVMIFLENAVASKLSLDGTRKSGRDMNTELNEASYVAAVGESSKGYIYMLDAILKLSQV